MTGKMIVLILATATSQLAYGSAGSGKEGGGGDVCQDRIEAIRNDISAWIQAGGSAGLDFSKSGTTLADYNSKMQSLITLTRLNDQVSISCTDDQSLVQVEGAQKTCVAYPDASTPRILCYRGQSGTSGFMGLSQDDQYFQIHHELAVLAKIEDQAGQDSDYPLSDQISGYLQEQVVEKLAVNKSGCATTCTTDNFSWGIASRYFAEGSSPTVANIPGSWRLVGRALNPSLPNVEYIDGETTRYNSDLDLSHGMSTGYNGGGLTNSDGSVETLIIWADSAFDGSKAIQISIQHFGSSGASQGTFPVTMIDSEACFSTKTYTNYHAGFKNWWGPYDNGPLYSHTCKLVGTNRLICETNGVMDSSGQATLVSIEGYSKE